VVRHVYILHSGCDRPGLTDVLVAVKVGQLDDFSTEPQHLHTEPVDLKTSRSSGNEQQDGNFFFFPIFFLSRGSMKRSGLSKDAFEASKKKVSDLNSEAHVGRDTPVRTFTP